MSDHPPPSPPVPPSFLKTDDVAGKPDDKNRARLFPCEGCGADFEFNIGAQQLKCPHCGFTKELDLADDAVVAEQDFQAALERVVQKRRQDSGREQGLKQVRCGACGGTVRFSGTITSSECSYCGVPLLLEGVHDAEDRIPVDGVLAFLIDRDTARANLKTWVKSRWFAPNDFKSRGVQGKFNGIYLPFWTFDSMTFTRYTGQRGEYYWVTRGSGKSKRRVRKVRWYPASGSFQRFFDDVLVIAGRGLPEKRITALEPWPLKDCNPFNPEVLAGFLARTYDVPLDEGFVDARGRMADAIEIEVRQRIGGDTQRIHSIDTRHDAVTYKHLLLPVWMLAYRFKKKSYQVVVNAGTGEVQGDRPYSWIKITLTVLAGAAAAVLIAYVSQ